MTSMRSIFFPSVVQEFLLSLQLPFPLFIQFLFFLLACFFFFFLFLMIEKIKVATALIVLRVAKWQSMLILPGCRARSPFNGQMPSCSPRF